MPSLANKIIFITGASRGIGKAIALRAARNGANVVVAAKTVDPHHKLPGTIYDTVREIEAAGGRALAVQVDIRSEDQVQAARKPEIMADAAHVILCSESRTHTGKFHIDEDVLRSVGVESFDQYAVTPGATLKTDIFLPD